MWTFMLHILFERLLFCNNEEISGDSRFMFAHFIYNVNNNINNHDQSSGWKFVENF